MKLTNRSKVVSKKEMTLGEKIYIPEVAKGMAVTLRHFFRKNDETYQYPEKVKPRAKTWRSLHVLKVDDEGRERCTACGLCAVACPAEAITMTAAERTKDEVHLYREEKYASVYEIDMLRCIFCGLCEEACPKSAIYLTDQLVEVDTSRNSFIYGKDRLLETLENRVDISARQSPKQREMMKDNDNKDVKKK